MKYKLIFLNLIICSSLLAYDTNKTQQVFTHIMEINLWGDKDSISGDGSNLRSTRVIRKEIPKLLRKYNVQTLLDAPCGDFFWMKEMLPDLPIKQYIGVDIVKEIVSKNQENYQSDNIQFLYLDLIKDTLPKVDLILCRDCILHFSHRDILLAFKNLKKSGAKYILMTHFSKSRKFVDISTGNWRPINFLLPPFNFPEPQELIVEECLQAGFPDKCLGLWNLETLPI